MLTRPGFSLAELVVAITLAAVVLGAATSSLLRQQRSHARVLAVTDGDAQTRAAMMVMGSQLAAVEPAAGDMASGQAEDTAIQFRALVAASLACGTEVGAVTLVPTLADSVPLGGSVSDPRASDSLWWLGDSTWHAAEVTATTAVQATCGSPVTSAGTSRRVVTSVADTIPAGAPLRVTRQARFGIYRAGDGSWQLGYREWNEPTHRFAAPQPVVGPLVRRAGNRRTGFRYFDSAGLELLVTDGPIDVLRVARIRITALTLVPARTEHQDSVRSDSIDIALRRAHVR